MSTAGNGRGNKMICRICGEEFKPALKHPGYIDVCLEEDCRANGMVGRMESETSVCISTIDETDIPMCVRITV